MKFVSNYKLLTQKNDSDRGHYTIIFNPSPKKLNKKNAKKQMQIEK